MNVDMSYVPSQDLTPIPDKVSDGTYDVIDNNCQDWADRLRNAYEREKEAAEREKNKKGCKK